MLKAIHKVPMGGLSARGTPEVRKALRTQESIEYAAEDLG